jgi:hypothetical protein
MQVDQFGDVPGDEVVLLCPADRPDQRALDLYERGFAEYLGGVLNEPSLASLFGSWNWYLPARQPCAGP